jgi:DNA-directed RNA polymerase specialized sigma24 family protein
MDAQPRRVTDEEDVAISVFKSLWHGAVRGQFSELTDRDDLWNLLLTITRQKTVDEFRRNKALKRGGGNVRGDSVFANATEPDGTAGFDHFMGEEPTPELVALMNERLMQLLRVLRDDSLRNVAVWRMDGYTNAEIAAEIGLGERSVERKLRLIREKWSAELEP